MVGGTTQVKKSFLLSAAKENERCFFDAFSCVSGQTLTAIKFQSHKRRQKSATENKLRRGRSAETPHSPWPCMVLSFASPKHMLLRRYIGQRLHAYYAQSADSVVGGLEPLNFSSLWGQWHWMRLYRRLYKETHGQWLTPVELFQPHFSQVIANYIISCSQKYSNVDDNRGPVDIVELGGGRGTNARHVMDHLAATQPDLYERATYRLVDDSPSLLQLQQKRLHETPHGSKFQFSRQDLLQVAESTVDLLPPSDHLTIVVGLEVLDNLPHDKIRIRGKSLIDQAIVRKMGSSQNLLEEVFLPLDDALIKRVLELGPEWKRVQLRHAWIPTVICGVLDHLYQNRPNTHVVLADFDWLPAPDSPTTTIAPPRRSRLAVGEPIVTDMDDVDQACYLSGQISSTSTPQLTDILFPTDFNKLATVVRAASGGTVEPLVQKQSDFLQTYGPEQIRATKSWLTGFTPMLGDFGNCSVLTTTVT